MAGIVEANMAPPHTFIRVPPGQTPPEGATATPVKGCWLVDSAQEAGGFRVQDIGSQSVVPLLDLQPGQRFLDLCAAPGNKTAQALEAGVRAVAADQHRVRLMQLTDLGVPLVRLDARRPLPFGRVFDRILVDAPCTGTGTLSRNPEIKWRLRPEDLPELQARQAAILEHALDALAPGGRLVYATCSLEPEENDQVVAPYKDRIVRILRRIPGRDLGDGFFAAAIQGG
jgi:16S rRNA (cytosine967-C5)-methyltransferase